MFTSAKLAIGGTLIGMALMTATAAPSLAQEPAAEATPSGQAAMMPGAETGEAQMAEMMDQCLAMMEMMSMMMGMMGGDMSGMEGMEGMPAAAATPAPQ